MKKKKKSKKGLTVFLILFIFIVGVGAAAFLTVDHYLNKISRVDDEIVTVAPENEDFISLQFCNVIRSKGRTLRSIVNSYVHSVTKVVISVDFSYIWLPEIENRK